MIKKHILVGLLILLSVGAMLSTAAFDTYAQQGDGGENFIFINYIGRPMSFDLDDVTYSIPGTDTVPEGGRLALQLPVGDHKFAANIPGIRGYAGEFSIAPGQGVAKAARVEQTSPEVKNGILVAAPDDFVAVFDFDPLAQPAAQTLVLDTWQPEAAAPGSAGLVFNNFAGDELTVDLNGQLYKVAPPDGDIPGRLQLDVLPGEYRYTASVPAGSINGKIMAVPGLVTGLTVFSDPLPEREYRVGEEFEFLVPVTMHVVEEDLTSRAVTDTGPATPLVAPAALPDTGDPTNQVEILPPAFPAEGLVVKNFAGDALTLTIDNQAHLIPADAERTLPLAPGHYTFTASIPFVAKTGELDLQAGQVVELSIAINVAHDLLNVYMSR
jgi:hypothetical protein